MNTFHFYKYHGTGNDFVILDGRQKDLKPILTEEIVSRLCHRRFGVGADGVMILEDHPDLDFTMLYYNSDGSPSSMCGNGGRCLVAFAKKLKIIDDHCEFMAIDGPHEASIEGEKVELKMTDVNAIEFLGSDCILDTGSPHYIKTVQNLEKLDVVSNALAIRNSDRFRKDGINVNFVEQVDNGIQIRTFERGVEDETWACGTGATAAAIAHAKENELVGRQSIPVRVEGGDLEVKFTYKDGTFTDVWLCGPAKFVFEGTVGMWM